MVKEITEVKYVCEVCGVKYNQRSNAEECEAQPKPEPPPLGLIFTNAIGTAVYGVVLSEVEGHTLRVRAIGSYPDVYPNFEYSADVAYLFAPTLAEPHGVTTLHNNDQFWYVFAELANRFRGQELSIWTGTRIVTVSAAAAKQCALRRPDGSDRQWRLQTARWYRASLESDRMKANGAPADLLPLSTLDDIFGTESAEQGNSSAT